MSDTAKFELITNREPQVVLEVAKLWSLRAKPDVYALA